ncbi:hypothetical protein MMC06_004185 [Schaereria dolodes]|nr:hypothetical protein [Schaereria dolodes]
MLPPRSCKAESPSDEKGSYESGITVRGLNSSYLHPFDFYKPVTKLYASNEGKGAKVQETSSLHYLRFASPIEYLDVCTLWRELRLEDVSLFMEIQGVLDFYIESEITEQLKQMNAQRGLEPTSSRGHGSDEDACSNLPHEVHFRLGDLIAKVMAILHPDLGQEISDRSWEYLMERVQIYLISCDYFVEIKNSKLGDIGVRVSLRAESTLSQGYDSLAAAEVIRNQDFLSFSQLDILPREGQELRIVPHYRQAACIGDLNSRRSVIYSIESPLPWLKWDSTISGFKGRIPMYSEYRAFESLSGTIVAGTREGPYAILNILRIEVKAVLMERCSLSSVCLQRTVRTRLNIKVIPWYAHASAHAPTDVASESLAFGAQHDGVQVSKENEQVFDENYDDLSSISSFNLDEMTLSLAQEPADHVPRETGQRWEAFDSKSYDVESIFIAHRPFRKPELSPGSPRKPIDTYFGLGYSDNASSSSSVTELFQNHYPYERPDLSRYRAQQVDSQNGQQSHDNYSTSIFDSNEDKDDLFYQDSGYFDPAFSNGYEEYGHRQGLYDASPELFRIVEDLQAKHSSDSIPADNGVGVVNLDRSIQTSSAGVEAESSFIQRECGRETGDSESRTSLSSKSSLKADDNPFLTPKTKLRPLCEVDALNLSPTPRTVCSNNFCSFLCHRRADDNSCTSSAGGDARVAPFDGLPRVLFPDAGNKEAKLAPDFEPQKVNVFNTQSSSGEHNRNENFDPDCYELEVFRNGNGEVDDSRHLMSPIHKEHMKARETFAHRDLPFRPKPAMPKSPLGRSDQYSQHHQDSTSLGRLQSSAAFVAGDTPVTSNCSPYAEADGMLSPPLSRSSSEEVEIVTEHDNVDPQIRREQAALWLVLSETQKRMVGREEGKALFEVIKMEMEEVASEEDREVQGWANGGNEDRGEQEEGELECYDKCILVGERPIKFNAVEAGG